MYLIENIDSLIFPEAEFSSEVEEWKSFGKFTSINLMEDLKFLLYGKTKNEKEEVIQKLKDEINQFDFLDERVILLKLLKDYCFNVYLYPNRHLDDCFFSVENFIKVMETLCSSYKLGIEHKPEFLKSTANFSKISRIDSDSFIFRNILSIRALVENDTELLEILDNPTGVWETFLQLLEIETSRVLARNSGLEAVSWRTAELIFPVKVYSFD